PMYYFYIIYSDFLDRYYVGSCRDTEERLRRHNSNHRGFTGKADDWRLVYRESFPSKAGATSREREVKGWKSRKLIEVLVNRA
ncbi:GIY-YIG nuclease family protein, partial [Parapedobacter soli]|uniref:GIY-YIG nuclease family protein n=1 Tax=Parapedobacter soli TaxID=416955 RepID=UPI0029057504